MATTDSNQSLKMPVGCTNKKNHAAQKSCAVPAVVRVFPVRLEMCARRRQTNRYFAHTIRRQQTAALRQHVRTISIEDRSSENAGAHGGRG